jgi:predicted RNase H-like HicB family nuclease
MKTMKKQTLPYQITVRWSAVDESYEAAVPALRTCIAYGDTPAEAVGEVVTAASLWLKVAEEDGLPIPAPDVSRDRLQVLAPLLNLSALAREAKMPVQTLASKLKRGTPLNEQETERVAGVLQSYGVAWEAQNDIKYAGYITRQTEHVEKTARMEDSPIPHWVDYKSLNGLKHEAKLKLAQIRPATFGQAARIQGVTPADLAVIAVASRAHGRRRPYESRSVD